MENEAEECREFTDYIPLLFAKSTLYVSLTFLKIEKTKCENFSFVHLSSFFPMHNLKTCKLHPTSE